MTMESILGDFGKAKMSRHINHSGWFAVSAREVFGCYGISRSPKCHVQMISAVP